MEDKITNGVGTLDREIVVVPGLQEPGVCDIYKLASGLISPELEKLAIRGKLWQGIIPDVSIPCIQSRNRLPCNSVANPPTSLE